VFWIQIHRNFVQFATLRQDKILIAQFFRRIKDVDSVPVVLVGNNVDSAGRVISLAEGEEWAKQNGWGFFETSAKDNINVDNAFIAISRRVSNNRHRLDARPVKKK
jgi:GTPase SAR1 family protein